MHKNQRVSEIDITFKNVMRLLDSDLDAYNRQTLDSTFYVHVC